MAFFAMKMDVHFLIVTGALFHAFVASFIDVCWDKVVFPLYSNTPKVVDLVIDLESKFTLLLFTLVG